MTNELATVGTSAVEINKAFGFDQEKMKPLIPYLKINGNDEEEGTAPKGVFTLDNGENLLYANEVVIRSFMKAYQYRAYHATDKTKNDMSTIERTFKGEFRSLSGRTACGKMANKKYKELGANVSAAQKTLQDSVKCKLLVFGVVSGTFTDLATKKEVIVEDDLFMWTVSQSAFMVMDQAITGIGKENRAVPCTPIKLKLKKEKNGAVTYFVPVPEVLDWTAELKVTRDGDYLAKVRDFVKGTNDYINTRYNAAIKGKQENENFASSLPDDDVNDL